MNNDSSRSHTILTILIQSKTVLDDEIIETTGKIRFVDLAGSE